MDKQLERKLSKVEYIEASNLPEITKDVVKGIFKDALNIDANLNTMGYIKADYFIKNNGYDCNIIKTIFKDCETGDIYRFKIQSKDNGKKVSNDITGCSQLSSNDVNSSMDNFNPSLLNISISDNEWYYDLSKVDSRFNESIDRDILGSKMQCKVFSGHGISDGVKVTYSNLCEGGRLLKVIYNDSEERYYTTLDSLIYDADYSVDELIALKKNYSIGNALDYITCKDGKSVDKLSNLLMRGMGNGYGRNMREIANNLLEGNFKDDMWYKDVKTVQTKYDIYYFYKISIDKLSNKE